MRSYVTCRVLLALCLLVGTSAQTNDTNTTQQTIPTPAIERNTTNKGNHSIQVISTSTANQESTSNTVNAILNSTIKLTTKKQIKRRVIVTEEKDSVHDSLRSRSRKKAITNLMYVELDGLDNVRFNYTMKNLGDVSNFFKSVLEMTLCKDIDDCEGDHVEVD